jgi:RimJ/RimL family protein N-acetyltransferase
MRSVEPRPPDEIELDDVVLRRWAPADVPALTVAAVESLDHLQPWMEWATPAAAVEPELARFVAGTTARAADGSEATYGIFSPAGAVLGGVGLHDRVAPGGIEIGYWLHVAATGCGLMTRVVAHLTAMALAMDDIRWVEIRCDQANTASAAIPQRLGFTLAATIPSDRPQAPADTGIDLIWTRTAPLDV